MTSSIPDRDRIRNTGLHGTIQRHRQRVLAIPQAQQKMVAGADPDRIALVGALIFMSGTAAAPFIYTLF